MLKLRKLVFYKINAWNMYLFFWEDVFAQKFGDDSKEGSAENVGFLAPVYKSSHLIP